MNRKRWTAKTEVTDSVLKTREKRKWQIALRRYVLEKNKSSFYAPYFGLDIENFRKWIELQFDEESNWENFSENWQFEHIVPLSYFDFDDENDLKLCWNFVNIRIERTNTGSEKANNRIDVLAAKLYFKDFYQKTNYAVCYKMVEKLESIESSQVFASEKLQNFVKDNKNHLETISSFTSFDYDKLNTGTQASDIVFEKEFLKKFG